MPADSRCNIGLESGKYRWGVFRGFIVRAIAGSAAGIVTSVRGGAVSGHHSQATRGLAGPLAAIVLAAALAACSTATPPADAPGVSLTDIAYRLPQPARPHFALSEIASLAQMTDRQLTQRLGTPDFTRHDEPAEIWQYRSASCVLDVFLYPEDGGLKVVHATTRDRVKLGTPDNSCTPFPDQRSASAQ